MLQETRQVIKDKLTPTIEGISLYRGRLEKIKIGGVSINTVDQFLKKDRKLSNRTILKLIEFFKLEYDKVFFDATGIIKIITLEENKL